MSTSTTLRQLATGSARLLNIIGTGETLNSADMDVMIQSLVGLTDSWSNNRLMIYNITEHVFPLTGKVSYTLGLGGDWDVGRPMKIEYAYARLNNGTQQQLDIGNQPLTVGQYAGIAVKNTPGTFSFAYYDDNSYPLRTISFFPIPAAGTDIVLWLREPLVDFDLNAISYYHISNAGSVFTDGFYPEVPMSGGSGVGAAANFTVLGGQVTSCVIVNNGSGYTVGDQLGVSYDYLGSTAAPDFQLTVDAVSGNLDSPINFPPGYERAFRFNLALEAAAEFGKTVSSIVMETAIASKLEIERLNSVPRFMRGDGATVRTGRNRYFNWITGNWWSFSNGN